MMPAVPNHNLMSAPAARAILLIDDDDLIAGSLRQVLVMEGRDVDVALDPGAAATLMAAKSYDVIVVDPYLTGGVHHEDGELITSIRSMQPEASLIVLTGYGSPALTRAATDGRVSAMLTKPQSIPFLTQFVAGAIAPEPSIKGRPE
jgi:two-component system response regulator RegA